METDTLLQLAEAFVSKASSQDMSKTLEFNEPFQAGETLELSGNTVFHKEMDLTGHTLHIYGDVLCKNAVSNATLFTYGDIHIEGECRNCKIFSNKSIHVSHTIDSLFWAYNNITIDVESVSSSYTTAASIIAPTASIRSGRLAANNNIILESAYSLSDATRLALVIGDRKIIIAKIAAIDADIKFLHSELQQVVECIDIFARKIVEKRLMGVHIPQFEDVKRQKVDIENTIKQKQALREQVVQLARGKESAGRIIVLSRAGADLFVEIEGSRLETRQEYESVEFSTDGKEVFVERYTPKDVQQDVEK